MSIHFNHRKHPLISSAAAIGILLAAGLGTAAALEAAAPGADGVSGYEAADTGICAATAEDAIRQLTTVLESGDTDGWTDRDAGTAGLVEAAFGADCWEQASFSDVDGPPCITREAYVLSATGEEISREEYERLRDAHVDQVCREYSFDKAKLSLQGEALENLPAEERTALFAVDEKINAGSPVRVEGRAAVPYAHYRVSFGGESAAEDAGICDVEVDLVQIDGCWVFYSMHYSAISSVEDDV